MSYNVLSDRVLTADATHLLLGDPVFDP